jgi:lysozyme
MALIKSFEGRALHAYRCPAGVLTIGYGHTSMAGSPPVTAGMTITPEQADMILAGDIDLFEDGVAKLLRPARVNRVEPHEFDAMVSLAFNIGLGAFARSTVLARYLRGDKAGAAAAFGFWVKANGKTLAGLVRRRAAEAKLFKGKVGEAEAIVGDGLGPMAQKIDKPKPPKGMASSKTGNAAVAAGAGGAAVVVDAAGKAIEQANKARDTAQQAGEVFGLSGSTALLIGAGLIIVVAAIFIWWDRRRRLREDLA